MKRTLLLTLLSVLHIYAIAQPNMALKRKVLDLDTIAANKQYRFYLPYTNTGDELLVIRECVSTSSRIRFSPGKQVLNANGKGHIYLRLDTKEPGRIKEKVTFTTNDPKHPRVVMTLKAVVTENAPGPKLVFDTTFLNLDTLDYNSDLKFFFTFRNEGNGPLLISNCQSSGGSVICGNYSIEPFMPGEAGRIAIHYDAKRVGPSVKSLTITSNDPESPVCSLTVKLFIRDPKESPDGSQGTPSK